MEGGVPGGSNDSGACKDKWDAIQKVLDLLVESGRVPAARRGMYYSGLQERERSMSTGMERGIALPHAAVEGIDDLVTALVVFRNGVPFQSIDGLPARILVMLLIPKDRRIVYLPVLAEAARLLSRDDVREGLLAIAGASPRPGIVAAPELFELVLKACPAPPSGA